MWRFSWLLLPSVHCLLLPPEAPRSIVGGSEVAEGAVPFQGALLVGLRFTCGASIVHPVVLVTAAHCVHGKPRGQGWWVRVGSTSRERGGSLHPVARVLVHEQFQRPHKDHDFALLAVGSRIAFSASVQPLRLAAEWRMPPGTLLTASGWGRTCGEGEAGLRLRAVQVPLVGERRCRQLFREFTGAMLCAGYEDRRVDASQGDSGGPLVHNGTLVGVTSFGHSCTEPNAPGVYARISAVHPWIVRGIRELERTFNEGG